MFSRRRLPSPIELAIAAVASAAIIGGAFGLRSGEPEMPNPKLTPGEALPYITLADIREIGFQKTTRDVDQAKREAVAKRYGLPLSALHHCEVDHLIPASWGGASTVENLWPQSYHGKWNAKVKDRLEVSGLVLIRAGKIDLKEAQKEIAADWKDMYKRLCESWPVEQMSAEEDQ